MALLVSLLFLAETAQFGLGVGLLLFLGGQSVLLLFHLLLHAIAFGQQTVALVGTGLGLLRKGGRGWIYHQDRACGAQAQLLAFVCR